MIEKNESLDQKQEKIDEIVELAERTELSIKNEDRELKKITNELSKA